MFPDVTLCSSLQPHTSPHHSFSSADLKPSLGPGCTAQNPWFTFQGSLAANQPCPCVPPAGRLSAVATGLGCQVGRSKRTPVREGGNLCHSEPLPLGRFWMGLSSALFLLIKLHLYRPPRLEGSREGAARGILRLCPASACQTGLPWSSPPA